MSLIKKFYTATAVAAFAVATPAMADHNDPAPTSSCSTGSCTPTSDPAPTPVTNNNAIGQANATSEGGDARSTAISEGGDASSTSGAASESNSVADVDNAVNNTVGISNNSSATGGQGGQGGNATGGNASNGNQSMTGGDTVVQTGGNNYSSTYKEAANQVAPNMGGQYSSVQCVDQDGFTAGISIGAIGIGGGKQSSETNMDCLTQVQEHEADMQQRAIEGQVDVTTIQTQSNETVARINVAGELAAKTCDRDERAAVEACLNAGNAATQFLFGSVSQTFTEKALQPVEPEVKVVTRTKVVYRNMPAKKPTPKKAYRAPKKKADCGC